MVSVSYGIHKAHGPQGVRNRVSAKCSGVMWNLLRNVCVWDGRFAAHVYMGTFRSMRLESFMGSDTSHEPTTRRLCRTLMQNGSMLIAPSPES